MSNGYLHDPRPLCQDTAENHQTNPSPVPPHAGLAAPITLGDEVGAAPRVQVTGWLRAIAWTEFVEVQTRPQNVQEDAQINPVMEPSREISSRREGGQFSLGEFSVAVRINKQYSWVVKSQKSSALLTHEQVHYDILGLHVRDLVADLRTQRAQCKQKLQQEVTRRLQHCQASPEKMDDKYDSQEETDHGRNAEAQARWGAQVESWIRDGTRVTNS